jgi:hypothetical protein
VIVVPEIEFYFSYTSSDAAPRRTLETCNCFVGLSGGGTKCSEQEEDAKRCSPQAHYVLLGQGGLSNGYRRERPGEGGLAEMKSI